MKKNKKGFTLIELLAVIIILAIIALIAVPIVMNLIEQSKRSAFEDTAYGIIKAGELYYSKNMLLNSSEAMTEKSFDFSDKEAIKVLNIKGSLPESGTMNIDKDGNVTIALSNGKYCAKLVDDKVVLDTDLEKCTLLPEPVQVVLNPSNACVTSSTPCTLVEIKSGISMQIDVGDGSTPTFYVISDDGNKLVLIMDRNIGGTVAWISREDYIAANTDNTTCSYTACVDEGSITALNILAERTSTWTNINFNYILVDTNGPDKYESVNKIGVHSRMLTYVETSTLGCVSGSSGTCPSWLYANLNYPGTDEQPRAYWMNDTNNGGGMDVYFDGSVGARLGFTTDYGLRPVIEIPKVITE